VTVHASGKEKLFRDKKDLERFFEILKDRKQKYHYHIYGFVLMPDHYHLIIETHEGANISKVMQALNTSYILYFNHRHRRVGHLIAGRFESRLVKKDRRLLELTRYIHLDPVKKELVKLPQDYAGSSYREYLGLDKRDLVDCEFVLSHLKGNEDISPISRYRKFVEEKKSG
jgi:REP element-mobilizing transposase RayT